MLLFRPRPDDLASINPKEKELIGLLLFNIATTTIDTYSCKRRFSQDGSRVGNKAVDLTRDLT